MTAKPQEPQNVAESPKDDSRKPKPKPEPTKIVVRQSAVAVAGGGPGIISTLLGLAGTGVIVFFAYTAVAKLVGKLVELVGKLVHKLFKLVLGITHNVWWSIRNCCGFLCMETVQGAKGLWRLVSGAVCAVARKFGMDS